MPHPSNTETNFFRLVGLEFILAGAWTFAIAMSQSLRMTTLIALAVIVLGVVVFFAPSFLKRQVASIHSVLGGRLGQLAAIAVPVILSTFLFLRTPSIDALKIIGPILACIWLIGIEILFSFKHHVKQHKSRIQRAIYPSFLSCSAMAFCSFHPAFHRC